MHRRQLMMLAGGLPLMSTVPIPALAQDGVVAGTAGDRVRELRSADLLDIRQRVGVAISILHGTGADDIANAEQRHNAVRGIAVVRLVGGAAGTAQWWVDAALAGQATPSAARQRRGAAQQPSLGCAGLG